MIRCHLSRYLAPLGFYQDTNFAQGNAYVVKPGDHPSLGGNNSVSSLRPLPIASEGDDGVITFFEDSYQLLWKHGGANLVLSKLTVKIGFNDQASSLIVIKSTWTVYVNTGYNGDAGTFPPGTYNANLGPNDAISSAKLN